MKVVRAEFESRQENIDGFVYTYRNFCWPVELLDDLKLAPFRLLETEGKIHTHQSHLRHKQKLAKICLQHPGLLQATAVKVINVTDPDSEQSGFDWWTDLTSRGSEGMVVKPLEFVVHGKKGLVQPAVKCRGREYLRITYGPDYTTSEILGSARICAKPRGSGTFRATRTTPSRS